MSAPEASVRPEGEALHLGGALVRETVPALWRAARPQAAGVRNIDITGATALDSAGLALLSALADAAGPGTDITGTPPGLAELRAAYRLDPALGFAT